MARVGDAKSQAPSRAGVALLRRSLDRRRREGDGVSCRHGQVTHPSRTGITTAGAAMNDPFEEQLRSTMRQVAQQTTTSHDLGMPAPSPRPSRSRRLVATAALTLMALVGVGVLVATRDDGPHTVTAAADDEDTATSTTRPTIGAVLANMCGATRPPSAMQEMIDKVCAGGSIAAANPFA